MTFDPLAHALAALAAAAAGFVNSVAGGGTLISFPTLTFLGLSGIAANVTNTVALCPGYFGGTMAQREDLAHQKQRLLRLVPAAILGGLVGGALLLATGEEVFASLVPWLVLLATLLLVVQPRIKAWASARRVARGQAEHVHVRPGAALAVFTAAIYGGYFGAGLGIVLLGVLGAVIDDDLVHVNALKQALSLAVNVTAALYFLGSGHVVISIALAMAVAALLAGHLGGRLAQRLGAERLRMLVIGLGLIVSFVYFVR